MKLRRIVGLVDPANVTFLHVLTKLGLTRTATIQYQGHTADRYVLDAPSVSGEALS